MVTKLIEVNEDGCDSPEFLEAAQIIKDGGLVAFPTETVYGLGADAMSPEASKKIYEAKGRPSDNPLIVHIAKVEDLYKVAEEVPAEALLLADVFWPGPLTMVLKKSKAVPTETTGGLNTVAVRLPGNKIARELIEKSGCFIAAPSANTSGRPSPTKASHVAEDMDGRIEAIIDGGAVDIGLESTIVDLTESVPTILRPGYITQADLESVLEKVKMDPGLEKPDEKTPPKAPGMRYRHYAPKGNLLIVEGEPNEVVDTINEKIMIDVIEGKKVGILATEENASKYQGAYVYTLGSRDDEAAIARLMYDALRTMDEKDRDVIYSESFSSQGVGQAIMNRLLKAAGHQVLTL